MDLKVFVEQFATQFDETDMSEFQPDTVFQDLDEWSSLAAMAIIAFVKTTYNKTVTGKEIRTCETIEDLYTLVSSK
jgi:acyl carrier protein